MRSYAVLTAFILFIAIVAPAPVQARPSADWPYPGDIPIVDETVAAQPAGSVEAELARFYSVRRATHSTISPDGRKLAFRTDTSGAPQLWIVPASGGTPTQMTHRGAVSSFYWTPDSNALVYFSDTDGDELTGFASINVDGKTEQPLQGAGEAFTSFGDFSSDGSKLIFSTTQRNGDDFDLYIQAMKGGAAEEVYRGNYGWFAQAWQPGGPYVVVTETRGEDGCDLYLFNTDTKTMIPVYQPKVAANFDQIEWTPDGTGFYLATNFNREFQSLAYYDMATGELSFLAEPQADIDAVSLGGKGQYLAYTVNEGGYSTLKVRDLKAEIDVAVPKLPPGVYGIEVAAHAPIIKISISSPQVPSDVWVYDFEKQTLIRATNSSAAGLDLSKMVVPEAVTFKAEDGVDLYGLFYPPRDDALPESKKPPVVVRLHGGPTGQARPTFNTTIQYLVARGYAVLDLNFRGSIGFGKTFARLDDMRKRPNAVRDIKDAMTWLETSGRVDTRRAAVLGGSYGGYLVNAVLGEYPALFSAGVSFVGVSDWVRALQEASPSLKASDRLEYGDISDPEDRQFFASISPINKAAQITAPVFVVHGANDPRDPVTESDAFVQKIREAGSEATYIRLSDEGHSIQKLHNRVYTYTRVGAFLDKHLMGVNPPEAEAVGGKAISEQLSNLQGKALAQQDAREAAARKAQLKDALAAATIQAETSAATFEEKQAALEGAEETLSNAEEALKAFDRTLSVSQKQIEDANDTIAEAETMLKEAKAKRATSTQLFDEAQADRAVAAEALQAAQKEKDAAQAALDKARTDADAAKAARKNAEQDLDETLEESEASFLERASDVVKSAIESITGAPAP